MAFLHTAETSMDKKQQIDASLAGSAFGQSARGDVATTLRTLSRIATMETTISKSGGWGSPSPTDEEGLVAAIKNLPSDATETG
jgi:hypothetical protein